MQFGKSFATAITVFVAITGPISANAELLDRGNGMIYDTVSNITWLQDANLASQDNFGVAGINASGAMNWDTAKKWIAAINTFNNGRGYKGYNDWRLTIAAPAGTKLDCSPPPAPPAPIVVHNENVAGYEKTSVNSELSRMYYRNLGNKGAFRDNSNVLQAESGIRNSGPFVNLQSYSYWTETLCPPFPFAWYFNTRTGFQHFQPTSSHLYVWPVRSGDVSRISDVGTTR